MEKVKYLILGAGPAGLTFANRLKQSGEDSFLVVEKETEAGGLCRSCQVDGSPFDIGGGHFLDVRRPKVNEYLFRFMPEEEWERFERDSRIVIGEREISHPLEANIWQMEPEVQVQVLSSIARAGCNSDKPKPEKFRDWITWKLGDQIAGMYMLPYNRKMFADELDELGIYWLDKLPDVSFEDTLRSCLTHKAYGQQPGHASFYYPKKYGYGELWLRMAQEIEGHVKYGTDVIELDLNHSRIRMADGEYCEAEKIITTIPWNSYQHITGLPEDLHLAVKQLKHSSIETRYVGDTLQTDAQWLYIPDEQKPYHRILIRHNFCQGSRGFWLETRKERVDMYPDEAQFCYMNEYAYPLNTIDKPQIMQQLLAFTSERQVYGLGRWGEHCHYNSDVVVDLAMKLSEKICHE